MPAVILDTDIGTDIDDTWALVQLLRSASLDLRLVTTCNGDTRYRARVAARLLDLAGRGDVSIGVGSAGPAPELRPQGAYVADYALESYPGIVHTDGVGAIIDTIRESAGVVTVIAIGPLTNLAEALRREPAIVQNARVVGMHGSVRRGYKGSAQIAPEYNVIVDPAAAREVFAADWPVTLTPLDTCGAVYLKDALYRQVLECEDPLVRALIENYRVWLEAVGAKPERLRERSTTLYDTVAVYLAEAEDLVRIEELGIRVDDSGYTRIDPSARALRVATEWRNLEAFQGYLVDRLTSATTTSS